MTLSEFPEFALQSSNGKTLVDGNAYGITIHGDGVLIGAFKTTLFCTNTTKKSQDVTIRNVKIMQTMGNVREVVTLRAENGKLQTDVAGSVVRSVRAWSSSNITLSMYFNHITFSCFNYITRITKMSPVSYLKKITRKSTFECTLECYARTQVRTKQIVSE